MMKPEDGSSETGVKIIGPEGAPVLPSLEYVANLLENLREEIERTPSNADVLFNFYYPLIAVVYNLTKITLSKINMFPLLEGEMPKIQGWFRQLLLFEGEILDAAVNQLTEGANDVLDQALIAYTNEYRHTPFLWHEATCTWLAQWLTLILEKKHWRGNPPFYVYIQREKEDQFPYLLPRIMEGNEWLSGFGSRLLILPGVHNLTEDQKAEIWNYLLTDAKIYEDDAINHTIRESVFDAILKLFPDGNISHLDLCGGKGDFIIWLKKHRPAVHSILIDLADKAVAEAHQREISSLVGTAEHSLPLKHQVDVITIVFAIQWLSPGAFTHVLEALKPGGYLIANIYPPDLPQIEVLFPDILKQVGFTNIELQGIWSKNQGRRQYIVRAQKPMMLDNIHKEKTV